MAAPDPDVAAAWLRGLAQDVLGHESCDGCKLNAAQALEHLGVLDEVLASLGIADPRLAWESEGSRTDMSGAYGSSLTVTFEDVDGAEQ